MRNLIREFFYGDREKWPLQVGHKPPRSRTSYRNTSYWSFKNPSRNLIIWSKKKCGNPGFNSPKTLEFKHLLVKGHNIIHFLILISNFDKSTKGFSVKKSLQLSSFCWGIQVRAWCISYRSQKPKKCRF